MWSVIAYPMHAFVWQSITVAILWNMAAVKALSHVVAAHRTTTMGRGWPPGATVDLHRRTVSTDLRTTFGPGPGGRSLRVSPEVRRYAEHAAPLVKEGDNTID
jgi:hypothetical protein